MRAAIFLGMGLAPRLYWIQTEHLGLTDLEVLYQLVEDDTGNRDWIRLDLLELATVPAELVGELEHIRDLAADAFDPSAAAIAEWNRSRGTF